MKENIEQKIINAFPEITNKLEYFESKWFKINQNGNREITEKNARDLIEKHFPDVFNSYTLEDLKIELGNYAKLSRNEEQKKRQQNGWTDYDDETAFILHMNKRHQLFNVNASGSVMVLNGKSRLIERLRVLASRYVKETGDKEIKPASLSDHLDVIIDDMAISGKEDLKRKIAFDPHASDHFDELLSALRITDSKNIHKNAIKHYMWQVKRKLWGFEPRYHFMLILFTNRQAFGKSTFLREFHLIGHRPK
ncbi:MAG: hypothetical protein J0M15_14975 [Deltaproteobacteria bacterium]|nr:hypothetical protein [Deltaproteobacteria bacterium]